MAEAPLHERIEQYLKERNVATLATAGAGGPWASPVFFASAGFSLYFVTDPKTRHGSNIGEGARVSAAITEDHRDWRSIRGLQLEGFCRPVPAGEVDRVMEVFIGKYPFAALFLFPGSPLWDQAGQKVRFYHLEPDSIWMTDNTRGFGQREHLALR